MKQISETFLQFTSDLSELLKQALPGHAAQRIMSPRRGGQVERTGLPGKDCRPGAVLLLLFPHAGQIHFVLIQRHDDMPHHAGQIALPGGAQEDSESLVITSLRETHEEIGVAPTDVTILGPLTPLFIYRSNFCVSPFVGICRARPQFEVCALEVALLIEVPMQALLNGRNKKQEYRKISGQQMLVPFYFLAGKKVWGATAMMLAEFEQVLRSLPSKYA